MTAADRDIPPGLQTEGVEIADIIKSSELNLDPKRHSGKFRETRQAIKKLPHFSLGEVLDIVPTSRFRIDPEKIYKYVEIERVGVGEYDYTEYRGWQLASRAKLRPKAGDIFIPHLWSCAGKWFVAAGDCSDVVVTNGCAQLRFKSGKEEFFPDLAIGLCSDSFSVQVRGFSTGSDGLAEISDDDLLTIVMPRILTSEQRDKVAKHLEPVLSGEARFAKFAHSIMNQTPTFPIPPRRKSHCALV